MVSLQARSGLNSTRKTRLAIEQLEDRLVPAISFAQYASGIWAYNSNNAQWRQIDTAVATVMDEGADGTLFASYGNFGTWRYNYSSNSWQQLRFSAASALSAANDNTLFASFSNGTWEYDTAGWHQLTTAVAKHLAAVSDNYFYGDYSDVTYKYLNGNWTNLLGGPLTTYTMDATSNGILYISYSVGTWRYNGSNGSWTQLSSEAANQIAAGSSSADPSLVYLTFNSGVWSYNGSWRQITSSIPTDITTDGGALVASYYGSGTWTYGNGRWDLITSAWATGLA